MNNSKNSVLVAIVLAAIAFFVFTQSKSSMAPVQSLPTPVPTVAETKEVPLSSGTISIEAGAHYYKPNILKLKKGEKVTLKFKAVDMMHNFNIDELGLKIPLTKSGDEVSVDFTPTKSGEFEYYCSIGQHRQLGQVGKLIVED